MKREKKKLPPLNCRRIPGIVLLASGFLMPVVQSIGFGAQGKDSQDLQKIYGRMEVSGKNFQTFYAKMSQRKLIQPS